MRPFVYRCPSTDIPVITQLYAGMFDRLPSAEFPSPYPCPCGHMHRLALEDKIVVTETRGKLPPPVSLLLPVIAVAFAFVAFNGIVE